MPTCAHEEQHGSDLGPSFSLTATAVLLLGLLLLHGLEGPSTQGELEPGVRSTVWRNW